MDQKELTCRAIEVAGSLDLGFMSESGSFDPTDSESPFGFEDIGRYMIYQTTNNGSDGYVVFADDRHQAEHKIAAMATDDWCVMAVYDLERDEYRRAVSFGVAAVILDK